MNVILVNLDRAISKLHQEYNSTCTFEEVVFIPTQDAVQAMIQRAHDLEAEVRSSGDVGDADAGSQVVRAHLLEVIRGLLARMEDDRAYPFRYLYQVSHSLTPLLEQDPRPVQRRLEILLRRLEQFPQLTAAVVEATARCTAESRSMTVQMLGDTASLLERLEGRILQLAAQGGMNGDVVSRYVSRAAAACRAGIAELRSLPIPHDPVVGLEYGDLLERVFGADVEELAARTRDDVADLEQAMLRVAHEIAPGKTPREILETMMPPYDDPQPMLKDMVTLTETARDACAQWLDLPDGELCRIEPVPPHLDQQFPWGGYSGPDTLAGHRIGTCYINLNNHRHITRGWLMNMALHEAYPGHHTQYVMAARPGLPLTARLTQLYSPASHALEGMAHRSEDKYQHIFGDEVFRLFVLYRRLHTAVRILCELEVNYFQNGADPAVALYRQYMAFPEEIARGQVQLQRMWRGYMTSYFTGARKLDEIQRESGLGDTEFSRILFSHGFVSLATLRRIALLEPAVRSAVFRMFEELEGGL